MGVLELFKFSFGLISELHGIEIFNLEHAGIPYIVCKISSKNLLLRIQTKLPSHYAHRKGDLKCSYFGDNLVYYFMYALF